MKTILSEIKNFRRLTKLTESDDKDVKVVLIGDQLTNELESNDFINVSDLRDDDMTIDKLLMKLSKQNPMPEVDHLFVSIGINDRFQDKKSIPFLIDALDNIFPNAEINIIKGIVGDDYFYGNEEVEDIKKIEEEILSYYNTFKQNGITVLGNYPSLDYGLGDEDKSINFLKKQMADSLFQNITNNGENLQPLSVDEPFIYKDNIDISGDDATDFDTIYEFLERFEEIVRSGNNYDVRVRNSFKPDIEQIQMALRFVLSDSDLEITGKYDVDTQEAIYKFQEQQGIEPTGIADQDTLEELLFDLKSKSFDDDDLGKYLEDLGIKKSQNIFLDGEVEIIGLGGEAETNAQLMIDYMDEMGIRNPYTQIGILSVIGKESGFKPQNEDCYGGTSNDRIRKLFGTRVPKNDKELNELKSNCEKFFDAVYGPDAQDEIGWNTGNTNKGDGYKYRGRGFNQITFKNTYARIGSYIGEDLVSNPDILNDSYVAAKAAVAFFTNGRSGSSLPDFTNVNDAINYFVDKNAGGHGGSETRSKAFEASRDFKVIP
jgi:predicted chitinase